MGEWNEYVKQRYDEGMRACLLPGDVHVYTYQNVDKYFPVINPDLWIDLRAYQDEQRKKGEPIVMSSDEALEFGRLCHRIPTQFNYVHAFTGHPGIQSITPQKPYGQIVNGRFTNFRWRHGHGPKGGSNG